MRCNTAIAYCTLQCAPYELIKKAKTVADAENTAILLGVKSAAYADNLAIGNAVNRALDTVKQKGLPIADHVKIDVAVFDYWRTQGVMVDNSPAAFSFDQRSGEGFLFINPVDPYWSQPKRIAGEQYQSGYWSTDQPFHAVFHEMGHLAHYKNSPSLYASLASHQFDAQERIVASKVSGYAIGSPREFVAEVFAALVAGRDVAPDVMMLYSLLGGVKP